MPLIVITGIPSSGKTTRTLELQKYFSGRGKVVHVVSEAEQIAKAGFSKNSFYLDSIKEKRVRGALKSEVLRLIGSDTLVILDGLNYIKGYRYELYCGSKANKCTQCTVHTEINRDEAWKFNENRAEVDEKYDRNTFDALLARYENPDGKNRWDSPLFLVFPQDELDKESIYNCLFNKAPPPPNMSTQNAPLSSANFLYDLDQVTKKIVDHLIQMKRLGNTGLVKLPEFNDLRVDVTNASIPQLMNLRRQYITYSKMHPPNPQDIPQLFVQYLSTSLH